MTEIKLTITEEIKLKEQLYADLNTKSEYHPDLEPDKTDDLNTLIEKYCYWGDEYNDGYIPEANYDKNDRLAMYLVQEFNKYMDNMC